MISTIPTRNHWKSAPDVLQDAVYVRMDPPFWAPTTDTQALKLPGWLADVHLPRRLISAACVFAATTNGHNLILPIVMPKHYPHFYTSIRNVTHPAIVRWMIAFCREAGISQRSTMYTTLVMQGLGIPCDNGIVDRPTGWEPDTAYWDFMMIVTGAATLDTYRSRGYRLLGTAAVAIEAGRGMEWINEHISRRRTTVRTLELVARTTALWRTQEAKRHHARVARKRTRYELCYEAQRRLVRRYYEQLEAKTTEVVKFLAERRESRERAAHHQIRIDRQWRRAYGRGHNQEPSQATKAA